MQIENIDVFKTWLVDTLSPICDADTDKLSTYIIALLKKDKTEEQLRGLCMDQLDVFLEKETERFVGLLFDVLGNKKYLGDNQTTTIKSGDKKPDDGACTTSIETESTTRVPIEQRLSRAPHHSYHSTQHRRNHNRRDVIDRSASKSSSSQSRSKSKSLSRSRSSSGSSKSNYRHRGGTRKTSTIDSQPVSVNPQSSTNEVQGRFWHQNKRQPQQRNPNYKPFNFKNKDQQQQQQQQHQPPSLMNTQATYTLNQPMYPAPQQPQHVDLMPHQMTPIMQQNFFQQQQQQRQQQLNMLRQQVNSRPRSLVNIVTHEDMTDDHVFEQPANRSFDGLSTMNRPPTGVLKRPYFNDNTINNGQFQMSHPMSAMMHNMQQHQTPVLFTNVNNNNNDNKPVEHMNNTLIICRIPRELNTEAKLLEHFKQFGKILNIKCNYEGNFDMAIVQFSLLAEAQSAYKCPQPLFNNRFIRLFWFSQKSKIRPRQQPQQQHQVNFSAAQSSNAMNIMTSSNAHAQSNMNTEDDTTNSNNANNYDDYDESVARKKHVKERLEFKALSQAVDTSMAIKTHTELVQNKENKLDMKDDDNQLMQYEDSQKPGDAKTQKSIPITKDKSQYKSKDETQRKALKLKLELSEKTQKLIEEQIKQQKILLGKIDQVKSNEEKLEILETIKKISELIEKEKESIVKQSTEFLSKANRLSVTSDLSTKRKYYSSSSTLNKINKLKQHTIINTKLYNHTKNSNPTSFLSAKPHAVVATTTTTTSTTMTTATKPSVYASPYHRPMGSSMVSIDNRPKQLIVDDIENLDEKLLILKHLKLFGNIDTTNDIDDKTMIINFSTRKDAEIALQKGSVFKNKTLNIHWYKVEKTVSQTASTDTASVDVQRMDTPTETNNEQSIVDAVVDMHNALDFEDDNIDDAKITLQADEDEDDIEPRSWRN